MSCLHLTIMRFWLWYSTCYPWKQKNNLGPMYCKSRDHEKPLQLAALSSMIHLEYNVQLGCYSFHSDMTLTIYSSGLPTSFHSYLPLEFHTKKTLIHKHLRQGRPDQIEPINGHFIQSVTHCYTARMQTPVSPPRLCQCSNQKYNSRSTFKNHP